MFQGSSRLAKHFQNKLHQNKKYLQNFDYSARLSTKSWTPFTSKAYFYGEDNVRTARDCSSLQANKQWLDKANTNRPLALMFPWVQYPPKAVEKFVNEYVSQGMDVLVFRVNITTAATAYGLNHAAQNLIVPCLLSINHQKVLLHGFCVGILLLTTAITHMSNTEQAMVFGRIRAQIWDSVIRNETSALGIAQTIVSPTWPRALNYAHEMVKFYKEKTSLGEHFVKTQAIFDSCPINAPALLLASEADPIGSVYNANLIKKKWNALKGVNSTVKTWKDSEHVGHMKKYPDEYWKTVESFLRENGFPGVREMGKEKTVAEVENTLSPVT